MKKTVIFRGVGTALITPFRSGRIDYRALADLIELQIMAGVDALIIGGTTGEAATLSDRERYKLFSFASEKCIGRVKLIFGTGTNDTRAAARHTKKAEEIGCDGVLVVTPYYNKGTEKGIENHYKVIANSTSLPIILYNVPSRTGVDLSLPLVEKLSECENIVAIKEASGSLDRLLSLSKIKDKIGIYSGNDSEIYSTLSLGGLGVISVVSNLLPTLTGDICRSYFEGRTEESLDRNLELLPLIRALFKETNPAPLKYAMSLLGLCSSELRLPLSEPSEQTKLILKSSLEALEELKNQ